MTREEIMQQIIQKQDEIIDRCMVLSQMVLENAIEFNKREIQKLRVLP